MKSNIIVGITLSTCLMASLGHAHCPKCEKIESERAREQAAHPQQTQYYDEAFKGNITPANANVQPSGQPVQKVNVEVQKTQK